MQCIDFASTSWCRLFCRLHGGELLLEALLLHVEALEQGQRQAEAAALAALQALHSLVRWAPRARQLAPQLEEARLQACQLVRFCCSCHSLPYICARLLHL